METEFRSLPSALTNAIDETVEKVLQSSDGGVPERVLEELAPTVDVVGMKSSGNG